MMLDPKSNLAFARIYQFDERKFANSSVRALPFSNRTARLLRQENIISIADLLLQSPLKMMQIEGFGIGCLKEIERELSMLDNSQLASTKSRYIPSTPEISKTTTKTSETITLGEKYGINPEEYVDVELVSIPFSARVTNALMRNQITTVALLLQSTEEQLRGIRNFGLNSLNEIDIRLAALCKMKKPKNRKFTINECHLMANGDFSFLSQEDVFDLNDILVTEYIEAQQTLGQELACTCIDNPEKIIPIINMFQSFGRISVWCQELRDVLSEVPVRRRQNQAIAYINTFTRHETERKMLLGMYPTPNAPLSDIVNDNTLLNREMFLLAKRFLSWCKFDLREEIANLFAALYPNERIQQVVQLRAQKKTLDQIGKKLGVTRERIRQLEKKAQRAFNIRQDRIKIVSKINADKNNTTIITPANVSEYCLDHLQELMYLLQGCESSNFTYDKDLDVFVIGSDSIHERVFSFVEKLPDIITVNDIFDFCEKAKDEYDLPQEMIDRGREQRNSSSSLKPLRISGGSDSWDSA